MKSPESAILPFPMKKTRLAIAAGGTLVILVATFFMPTLSEQEEPVVQTWSVDPPRAATNNRFEATNSLDSELGGGPTIHVYPRYNQAALTNGRTRRGVFIENLRQYVSLQSTGMVMAHVDSEEHYATITTNGQLFIYGNWLTNIVISNDYKGTIQIGTNFWKADELRPITPLMAYSNWCWHIVMDFKANKHWNIEAIPRTNTP